MKWYENLGNRIRGLTGSLARFPLAIAFLAGIAVMLSVQINTYWNLSNYLLACAVGAVSAAALQTAWERFFKGVPARLALMGLSLAFAGAYYLAIRTADMWSPEIGVRTAVLLFALVVAFLWLPVIRSRVGFNESFMAAFKSLFHSLLYSAVIMGGLAAIIGAVDRLIWPLDNRIYAHTANLVFVLFAPVFLLSLIPVYPGKQEEDGDFADGDKRDEAVAARTACPRFLEGLVSYIVIPLVSVFTLILAAYILLNIRSEFWTDNLLESMLIAYAIAVILVNILASRLHNRFAALFRKISPKVLIPIVLFQIASSFLTVSDVGLTYSRYFVILFGIFAVCAGAVLSVLPPRKNGIIAALLIAFAAVSILPPVDAFTVSRANQIRLLETTLERNGMLLDGAIVPSGSVPEADKKKIVSSVEYLSRMRELDRVSFLPADFTIYEDFQDTFGFYAYEYPGISYRSVNVYADSALPVDVAGYEYLARTYLSWPGNAGYEICKIPGGESVCSLTLETGRDGYDIVLSEKERGELIRFETNRIAIEYEKFDSDKTLLTAQEAVFSVENDQARLSVAVRNASITYAPDETQLSAEVYILVDFK